MTVVAKILKICAALPSAPGPRTHLRRGYDRIVRSTSSNHGKLRRNAGRPSSRNARLAVAWGITSGRHADRSASLAGGTPSTHTAGPLTGAARRPVVTGGRPTSCGTRSRCERLVRPGWRRQGQRLATHPSRSPSTTGSLIGAWLRRLHGKLGKGYVGWGQSLFCLDSPVVAWLTLE